MRRFALFVAVCCLLTAAKAHAAPPAPEAVQGLYEGVCKDASGERKLEARVVALGKKGYKALLRETLPDGKVAKIELEGSVQADAVRFSGKAGDVQWTAQYAEGSFRGTRGQAEFALARAARKLPTLGQKPPQGAIVLLDGKNFDELTKKPLKDGSEQPWKVVEDGALEVPKSGMRTKRSFAGSFKLHVEFKCPLRPDAQGQGRGNSGVYLPNGDEIQVLDSFGMTTYEGGGCGGLYAYKNPDAFDEFSLASLPPLEWQTYDIEYRIEMADGKPKGKPRVTVYHNGIKIHDNAGLRNDARAGTLFFQDHGNPVLYRNIWLLPQ